MLELKEIVRVFIETGVPVWYVCIAETMPLFQMEYFTVQYLTSMELIKKYMLDYTHWEMVSYIIASARHVFYVIIITMYNSFIGSPSITSLLFDGNTTTLVCTSTGGPPTTVTWRRSDALVDVSLYWQTQIVMDSVTATYENILGTDEVRDFAGIFTCEVSNIRGVDQQTLVDGTVIITIIYYSLHIS